jgi:hypothetical protein
MKRSLSILTVLVLLLTAAGSSLAESAAQTDATATATQAPSGETRYMGRITAVADSSVTISVMGGNGQPGAGQPSGNAPQNGDGQSENGTPPQGNNGAVSGNGQTGGNGASAPQGNGGGQGNAPQGGDNSQSGNGNAPQGGNGANAPQGGAQGDNGQGTAPETQTLTIAITDATVITSQEAGTALTASDLSADMMVSVTVSGDATSGYTALSIEVQTSQPAPTDGAAATSAS